jgi:hypothetical protein
MIAQIGFYPGPALRGLFFAKERPVDAFISKSLSVFGGCVNVTGE